MADTSPRFRVAALRALLAKGDSLAPHLGQWVLLGSPVEGSNGTWSYRTASVDSEIVVTTSGLALVVRDDDVALPVKKKPGASAFTSTVLLGRSDSNDVVIPHPSVSKLHARLDVSDPASVSISDAESSNGTKVGDHELRGTEKKTARSGTRVGFGSSTFLLVHVAELEKLLSRR